MKNFYNRILKLLPSIKEIRHAISFFSKKEYYIFIFLVILLVVNTIMILQSINKHFMVDIAREGGTISEGIIGTPRFVNPILASSLIEQDLVSLIYSGLMRKDIEGNLMPDLAVSYPEVSKDGLEYTFKLKDKIYFHNGEEIFADDVIFTIEKIKDPITKSSKKSSWDGVSVEKIDDKTIKFTLRQSLTSFLENTTLGIMPSKIWNNSPIELNEANIEPVGSGPYKITNVKKQSSGIIESYELVSFEDFALGEPNIEEIVLHFYSNENDLISALESGEVDQISSITPENALKLKEKGYRIEEVTLPRVFGVFFNQNQNQIFTDKNIVTAINLAINKERIINNVLSGYGISINNPIPFNIIEYERINKENGFDYEKNLEQAQTILSKGGWAKGENGFLEKTVTKNKKKETSYLEFSISTGNAKELAATAELIREDLEKIGIKVTVKTFETGNLNQSVIRPRKYDALLFGQIINHESDLFAFWHSSQRNDPGLNVAMYTNAKVDKILEEAGVMLDEKSRIKKYIQFEEEIKKDMPAIFLYSPNFIYVVSKDIKGFSVNNIISPADRFINSYLWYLKTDSVWEIFSK